MKARVNVANALTVGRMVCVPLLLASSWNGRHDIFFGLAAYCMLSDIFDGRIARWLGQSSEFGARLDSWADLMMIIGYAKFGKLTSYHTTAARLTAYLAGAGAIVAITWGWPWLFRAGAAVAVYSVLEEIAITFTLTQWTANVPSLTHARRVSSTLDVRP